MGHQDTPFFKSFKTEPHKYGTVSVKIQAPIFFRVRMQPFPCPLLFTHPPGALFLRHHGFSFFSGKFCANATRLRQIARVASSGGLLNSEASWKKRKTWPFLAAKVNSHITFSIVFPPIRGCHLVMYLPPVLAAKRATAPLVSLRSKLNSVPMLEKHRR